MTRNHDVDQLLTNRAKLLARPHIHDQTELPTVGILAIEVADGHRYAVEIAHVRKIVRNQHLRRLPGGSGALLGVVPAHGDVVPVADLGALLGLCVPTLTRPLIVVLDGGGPPLGLLVDNATEVVAWRTMDLRTARQPYTEGSGGSVRLGPHDTVILDSATLLNDPRLFVISPTTEPANGQTEQEHEQGCDR